MYGCEKVPDVHRERPRILLLGLSACIPSLANNTARQREIRADTQLNPSGGPLVRPEVDLWVNPIPPPPIDVEDISTLSLGEIMAIVVVAIALIATAVGYRVYSICGNTKVVVEDTVDAQKGGTRFDGTANQNKYLERSDDSNDVN